jgi:rare lipoprotein A
VNVIAAIVLSACFFAALFYMVPARAADPTCKPGEVRASWYGRESGSKTAAGLHFDGSQMIVAHKTLRFGTRVRFTYRGRSIVVPVGDRGPYIRGRTYDLSAGAARALGTKGAGVACVVAKVLP